MAMVAFAPLIVIAEDVGPACRKRADISKNVVTPAPEPGPPDLDFENRYIAKNNAFANDQVSLHEDLCHAMPYGVIWGIKFRWFLAVVPASLTNQRLETHHVLFPR
jgi:hypothetical protein